MTRADAIPVVVLISGSGTNLQALIDACRGDFPAKIVAVISNRPDVRGLGRATDAGIPTAVIDHTEYDSREAFDTALAGMIDQFTPKLVVLAGFMRILTPGFVLHYLGKLLNIHPSLLPRYPGLNTHQRALDNGDRLHGASIHFVTTELDGGPVILQASVPVHPEDDADTLAARVLEQEHKIYPLAVRWFAEGRLTLDNETPLLDQKPVIEPLQLEAI
ncbi:MAG: phosphoribosylglycinamide formyltransferase [bacterium]